MKHYIDWTQPRVRDNEWLPAKVYGPLGGVLPWGDEVVIADEGSRFLLDPEFAIDRLVTEGLVYRLHGRGTFVAEPRVAQAVLFSSFSEDMRARGFVYDGRLPPPKGELPEDWEDREQTLFRSTSVGDEGGFAPKLESTEAALDAIALAVKNAGYKLGKDIHLALDVASSEFYVKEKKNYVFKKSDGRTLSGDDMVEFYKQLTANYPIISIEDGCAESDWATWKKLTDAIGDRVQLVGDDLFVTNSRRLRMGIDQSVANSILVKVNQIGSLTETLDAVELAQTNSYTAVLSHRSGETEDATIADIAVATNCGQIKTGSLSRSDRLAKYNQLLRLEQLLGKNALYAGTSALPKGQ